MSYVKAVLIQLCPIFALALLFTLVAPDMDAFAQRLNWKVVFPDHDQRYHYYFTALSGYRESCIATMLKQDDSIKIGPKFRQMFLRTDDGGLTWKELDPGFPAHHGQNERALFKIQMIDSSTIVAIGDSGLLLRSTDAGVRWTESRLGIHKLLYVNFFDKDHGIIVSQSEPSVFTTLNGGNQWDSTTLFYEHPGYYWAACPEALGGSRFRVMSYAAGPLYYTSDNWKTLDTSRMLFDTSDIYHVITNMQSDRSDTIVAFGQSRRSPTAELSYGLVVRSTDGGRHWQQTSFPDTILTSPWAMTELGRPFMVAAGHGNVYKRPVVALSYDKGVNWSSDTVFLSGVDPNYTFSEGIYVTPSSHIISIFQLPIYWSPGVLAAATIGAEHVERFAQIVKGTRISPNPTRTTVTITSPVRSEPLLLVDLLGREAAHTTLDANGSATFDVHNLPRGIYSVVVRHAGLPIPVGRAVVVE